jgi:Ni/Co efflux regulator RcnB
MNQRNTCEVAWSKLKSADATLSRWTSEGATGVPFTFRVQSVRDTESLVFFREGRKVKSASYERFAEFYSRWRAGDRSPQSYRNHGDLRSPARVIHFLFPVFQWLEG